MRLAFGKNIVWKNVIWEQFGLGNRICTPPPLHFLFERGNSYSDKLNLITEIKTWLKCTKINHYNSFKECSFWRLTRHFLD